MSHSTRKFVAVLMLLWLPFFSGSALAATVSMQMPQGSCHEVSAPADMASGDMVEHHHSALAGGEDEQSSSCSGCGVCHLACTGYMAVPGLEMAVMPSSAREVTPYLVVFRSITFEPLDPPPLAGA